MTNKTDLYISEYKKKNYVELVFMVSKILLVHSLVVHSIMAQKFLNYSFSENLESSYIDAPPLDGLNSLFHPLKFDQFGLPQRKSCS